MHQLGVQELLHQLRGQVPALLLAVNEVDVDLGLAPPTQLGFVRVPDVVVVPKEALHRQRREGG